MTDQPTPDVKPNAIIPARLHELAREIGCNLDGFELPREWDDLFAWLRLSAEEAKLEEIDDIDARYDHIETELYDIEEQVTPDA